MNCWMVSSYDGGDHSHSPYFPHLTSRQSRNASLWYLSLSLSLSTDTILQSRLRALPGDRLEVERRVLEDKYISPRLAVWERERVTWYSQVADIITQQNITPSLCVDLKPLEACNQRKHNKNITDYGNARCQSMITKIQTGDFRAFDWIVSCCRYQSIPVRLLLSGLISWPSHLSATEILNNKPWFSWLSYTTVATDQAGSMKPLKHVDTSVVSGQSSGVLVTHTTPHHTTTQVPLVWCINFPRVVSDPLNP